jgi:hypothetical protein
MGAIAGIPVRKSREMEKPVGVFSHDELRIRDGRERPYRVF